MSDSKTIQTNIAANNNANEIEFERINNTYKNYIEKFCEIADRSVSTLDEWGDEKFETLPALKKECIIRIARKELDKPNLKDIKSKIDYLISHWFNIESANQQEIEINKKAPLWAQNLFDSYLPQVFAQYHANRKEKGYKDVLDINKMDGIEFENYIALLLKQAGYNVSGTPVTGDQGADLIALKNGKTYVVQVKRYSDAVGNKAVQEVVAAKSYYNGDIAAVITNSSFTQSAVNLAKKNNVVLINKSS